MHCDSDHNISNGSEHRFHFGESRHVLFLSAAKLSDLGLESQKHN